LRNSWAVKLDRAKREERKGKEKEKEKEKGLDFFKKKTKRMNSKFEFKQTKSNALA
jgi:hypothetical protein